MTLEETARVDKPIVSDVAPGDKAEASASFPASPPSLGSDFRINSAPLPTMNRGDTRKRWSTSSQEVCPVRDSVLLQRKLARKAEVRYMREARDYMRQKIRSASLVTDCNQKVCPKLQERLERHQQLRHHSVSKNIKETGVDRKVKDDAVHITPKAPEVAIVQTEMTMQDLTSLCTALQEESLIKLTDRLKPSETREVLAKKKFYMEYMQSQIQSWIHKIPVFRSSGYATSQLKNNLLNNLTENICKLSSSLTDELYDVKVEFEIENCLCKLPLWLSGNSQDKLLFKNFLKDRLFTRIKELNHKILGAPQMNTESKEIRLHLVESYERVVFNWLQNRRFRNDGSTPKKKQIATLIIQKLMPLLKDQCRSNSYKLIIKRELITILDDLQIILNNPKNRIIHLNKLAEDLANRLLCVQLKRCSCTKKGSNVLLESINEINAAPKHNTLNDTIGDEVKRCLNSVNISNRHSAESEICNTIFNSMDMIQLGNDNNLRTAISNILLDTGKLDQENINNITDTLIQLVKPIIVPNSSKPFKNENLAQNNISVYSLPETSTPKKAKKVIPKLNPEEMSYMEQVSNLIRAWMDTLPKSFDDDKEYKETMIQDLAGDIMDEAKLEQLSPETNNNRQKFLHFFVFRWLYRFSVFDDLEDANPHIDEFLHRLGHIPIPVLTASQHGTRQAMRMQQQRVDLDFQESCCPQGLDLLEDQISVWMNEQPAEVFETDITKRDEIIRELALKLQDHLKNKNNADKIEAEIKKWLEKLINVNEKEHIGLLTQKLQDIVINVPQDDTIAVQQQARQQFKKDYRESKITPVQEQSNEPDNMANVEDDPDATFKEFISNFIDHNYQIDDPMAKNAFKQILKSELRNLNPLSRQEVYADFKKSSSQSKLPLDKLNKQLEYIKIVSLWLNECLPVDPNFNHPNNADREQYVTDMARNIHEIEEQQMQNSDQMDFPAYLLSMIFQSVFSYRLPILKGDEDSIPASAFELYTRITPILSQSKSKGKVTRDTTASDIPEQNLSEFVDEYARLRGKDTDDPVKQDASARSKLQYLKEISEWMKELPLLPITDNSEAEKERAIMVNGLFDSIMVRQVKKISDPNDIAADTILQTYVSEWVLKLPLDPQQEVAMPIVVEQLMNRIDKIDRQPDNDNMDNIETQAGNNSQQSGATSVKNMIIEDLKAAAQKINGDNISGNMSSKASVSFSSKDPRNTIVEAVENWSNSLPIEGENKRATKAIKEAITRSLYQKINELNVDPRIYNDDVLYRDMLGIEIETQLENVPQNSTLEKDKDKLKASLLDTIFEAKQLIRELSAGNNYKHKLEDTIEASFPNPVQNRQVYDPRFEIYKDHLANMFILENFDHGNDHVKEHYEKRIKNEIDKYFHSALQRNSYPLTKEQIYNELYSSLFKVPVPNERSVAKEVEEIKTKCEIEQWFEGLPLIETQCINVLLECDQILSTLAKRICEIESRESKPDQKIHKEIIKWLKKLPIRPDEMANINNFASKLQNTLKLSAEARRCVKKGANEQRKGKYPVKSKLSQMKTISNSANLSQAPVSCKACVNSVIPKPFKKSADLMVEMVEDWCNQLPLNVNESKGKVIKDMLSMKILMELDKLNANSDFFDNDIVYMELLYEVIDALLVDLPVASDFQQSVPARKFQLNQAINDIKPLIREEIRRLEYKDELKNTVSSIIKQLPDPTSEQKRVINKMQDDIVDNFILKICHENDEETKRMYKRNVYNIVEKYTTQFNNDANTDPLIKHNQVLCELARVPIPNMSFLIYEAEDIKMKMEVEEFFQKNVPENSEKSNLQEQMINNLSKRLNSLEKSGTCCSNNNLMKGEIDRCLKKIDAAVSPKTIEEFVEKLEKNAESRRDLYSNQPSFLSNGAEGQWLSLLPASPNSSQFSQIQPEWNYATNKRATLGPSVVNFEGFEAGAVLSSTLAPQQPAVPVLPNNLSYKSMNQIKESRHRQSPRPPQSNATQTPSYQSSEVTSESLFRGPPGFERKPLYSPLNIPELSHSDSLLTSPEYPKVPHVAEPDRRRIRTEERGDVIFCKCRKKKRHGRGRPCYMITMEQYCEKCGGFRPTWCGMPYMY